MIYGFSALRVKNVSAIVIYLLSHQDLSAIILALNEKLLKRSTQQWSFEHTHNLLFLVKLKCQCAQMNKINKIPSTFFTVRNCEFSHNKLLLLCWKIVNKNENANWTNWNRFRYRPRLQWCKQFLNLKILFIRVKKFGLFGNHARGTHGFRLPLASLQGRH